MKSILNQIESNSKAKENEISIMADKGWKILPGLEPFLLITSTGWKAFKAEMKRKGVGTRAGKGRDDKSCKEELTVQRL